MNPLSKTAIILSILSVTACVSEKRKINDMCTFSKNKKYKSIDCDCFSEKLGKRFSEKKELTLVRKIIQKADQTGKSISSIKEIDGRKISERERVDIEYTVLGASKSCSEE